MLFQFLHAWFHLETVMLNLFKICLNHACIPMMFHPVLKKYERRAYSFKTISIK